MLSLFGICAAFVIFSTGDRVLGKPQLIKPGCRYEGRRYQEGAIVSTSEPCLQCRCLEGSLRCRLRICPRIPNPPPPECHLKSPADHICCPLLICGEPDDEDEKALRRSSSTVEETGGENGCMYEGVQYGPGSAMMSARRCEYCYCISGSRRCVRPKCLLSLPGCTPLYAPYSCCPVAYNCTRENEATTEPLASLNGCRLGDRVYAEGEMVRDITWKAPCDNCFCAMGAVRCVPLACSPPLQGCSPIVREGQCCPSTYNCSDSIEVKAAQNYASYAFISKDYAKFRKETNFLPADSTTNVILSNAIVEGRGHRVVDGISSSTNRESEPDATTFGFSEDSTSPPTTDASSIRTFETETMDNDVFSDVTEAMRSTTMEIMASTSLDELTTNPEQTTQEQPTSTSESATTESSSSEPVFPTTESPTGSTFLDDFTSTKTTSDLQETTTTFVEERSATEHEDESRITERSVRSTTAFSNSTTTSEPILLSNNQQNQPGNPNERKPAEPVTSFPTTILVPDDIFVMNVTLKSNVSVENHHGMTVNPVRSIPPDVQAILNITHREKNDDYDDDYSEPTLPPSLPNVRIIPFVAADALVKDEKDVPSSATAFPSGSVGVAPELRPTDGSGFYDIVTQENRFSPPVETEGGFVPREPPYFDVPYRSTDLNLEIGTGVTVHSTDLNLEVGTDVLSTDLNLEIGTGVTVEPAVLSDPHRKDDGSNCLLETREYHHGELLPSSGLCMICICYYGEVVCSDAECPPLKIGCRRVNAKKDCCGKVICVDGLESPTVVLDRSDAPVPSQRQPISSGYGIPSPDPFRDVIKTEPAPDLPSLIGDMMPYLVEHGISTSRPTTPMTTSSTPPNRASLHPDFVSQAYDYHENIEDPKLHVPNLAHHRNTYNFESRPTASKITGYATYGQNDPNKKQVYEPDAIFGPEYDSGSSSFSYQEQQFTRMDHRRVGTSTDSTKVDPALCPEENNTKSVEDDSVHDSNLQSEHEAVQSDHGPSPLKTNNDDDGDEDSIFSLGSVFDLLRGESTTSKAQHSAGQVTSTLPPSTAPWSAAAATLRQDPTFTTELSSTKSSRIKATISPDLENEVPMAGASLLKLAGCNIYGRMYRVGRIITELSGPCLECRCTEVGVQCKQLGC